MSAGGVDPNPELTDQEISQYQKAFREVRNAGQEYNQESGSLRDEILRSVSSNDSVDSVLAQTKNDNNTGFNEAILYADAELLRYGSEIIPSLSAATKLKKKRKDNIKDRIDELNLFIMKNENSSKVKDNYIQILIVLIGVIFLMALIYLFQRLKVLSTNIAGYLFIFTFISGLAYLIYVIFYNPNQALASKLRRASALTNLEFKKVHDKMNISGDCEDYTKTNISNVDS